MADDQSTISRRKLLAVSAMSGTAAVAGCSSAPDEQPKPFRYEPAYPVAGEDVTFIAPTFADGNVVDVDWNITETGIFSDPNQTKVVHQFDSAGKKVVEMSIEVERSPGDTYGYTTRQVITVDQKGSQGLDISTEGIDLLLRSRTNIVKLDPQETELLEFSIANDISNRTDAVAQLTIQVSSGIGISGTDSVDSGAGGIFTSDVSVAPGETESIGVHIDPVSPGEYEVKAEVTYYFIGERQEPSTESLSLPLNVVSADNRVSQWELEDSTGTWRITQAILISITLLVIFIYIFTDKFSDTST